MQTNQLPYYDISENEADCCPRFKPEPWDGQELYFDNKPFVKAETSNLFHIPLNFGKVFTRVMTKIQDAEAIDPND